eukprot:m.240003 g.240003  ORF g.240003 m.240003 type:complete len:215 (-) comp23017_c0_seq1:27-671(-)
MEAILEYNAVAAKENETKEKLKAVTHQLEALGREIETILQGIHTHNQAEARGVVAEAAGKFPQVQECYARLVASLLPEEHYRYNFLWRTITQQLCGYAALVHFLQADALVPLAELRRAIVGDAAFEIDAEDYLCGLCNLTQELARLAVNSVIHGDMHRPGRIALFVGEINNGFRLLNFKNDFLRKRYDAVKYDVKKIENVVYDITLRGLAPKPT